MPSFKLFNRKQRSAERAARGEVLNASAKPTRRAEIIGVDAGNEMIMRSADGIVSASYSFDFRRSA